MDSKIVDKILLQLRLEKELIPKVKSKALEFIRLVSVRTRGIGFGTADVGRHSICIALACEVLFISCDYGVIEASSGLTDMMFANTFERAKSILSIKIDFSIEKICNVLKVPTLVALSRKVFESYKSRRLARLNAAIRDNANFDQPVFAIACVYLAAKRKNQTLDCRPLLELSNTSNDLFSETRNSILEICYPTEYAQLMARKEATAVKMSKKRERLEKLDPEKKQKFEETYEAFKEEALATSKKGTAKQSKKAKTQTTLDFEKK